MPADDAPTTPAQPVPSPSLTGEPEPGPAPDPDGALPEGLADENLDADWPEVRVREALDAIPVYRPGKPPTAAPGRSAHKMSSNENPYPPLPSVLAVATEALAGMNRYPDASVYAVKERIAAELDVEVEEILVGAGSSGMLNQIIAAVVGEGDEVVYAWRSFELYPISVAACGGRSVQVPLTQDGRHDLPAMASAVHTSTRMLIVCSPNNPTGPAVEPEELSNLLTQVPSDVLVLLDEAYVEFGSDPGGLQSLQLYRRHPNLVLLRTFSKAYGLAGLRIGYAVAHPPLARALGKLSMPFVVTDIAQRAALASLDAREELMCRVKSVVAERERVLHELRAQGWPVPDTSANFVWLPLPDGDDALEFTRLADDAGLAVRPFAQEGVRVSLDTPEANDALVEVAAAFIRRAPGPPAPPAGFIDDI